MFYSFGCSGAWGPLDLCVGSSFLGGSNMKSGLSGKALLSLVVAGCVGLSHQCPAFAQSTVKNGFLVGAGPGGQPRVNAYIAKFGAAGSPDTLTMRASVLPFAEKFAGGVKVASGDINGDKIDDIIVAAGAGAPSDVRVLDGRTRNQLLAISPFAPTFLGGVEVAAGDVNGDSKDDIIVAAESGPPHVMVFDSATGKVLHSFYAYDQKFTGGITVGAVDVDGDGKDDIITGPGAGAPPHIKVFRGTDGTLIRSFLAYDRKFRGGVSVAGGFIDDDKFGDIIVGAGRGASSHVAIISGSSDTALASFYAFDQAFKGGIRVGATRKQDTGSTKVIVGAGMGGHSHVLTFNIVGGKPTVEQSFLSFQGFNGEVSVAGFSGPETE